MTPPAERWTFRWARCCRGAAMVEYATLLTFVTILTIASLVWTTQSIRRSMCISATALNEASRLPTEPCNTPPAP